MTCARVTKPSGGSGVSAAVWAKSPVTVRRRAKGKNFIMRIVADSSENLKQNDSVEPERGAGQISDDTGEMIAWKIVWKSARH